MEAERRAVGWIAAIGIAVAALALYLGTLAPTVALVDSGELIFAATFLDIPHPPGTPLYVLVGHLFSRLPVRNPAVGLNLMSALFAALAAAALFLAALRAFTGLPAVPIQRRKRPGADGRKERERLVRTGSAGLRPALDAKTSGRDARDPSADETSALPGLGAPALRLAAAGVAALVFATSATLWSYATVAEVYTLNTALLSLAVLFLLGRSELPLAFLFFGLALAVHHVSALFFLPGVVYLIWTDRPRSFSAKSLLFLIPGLATYLYLPIRALQHPILNWGNPNTLERLFWHVSGKQYRSNFISDFDSLLSRAWFFAKLAGNEFTIVGLAFALLGLGLLWSRSRRLFVFIALTVSCNLAYALVYEISEDNEAYLLPSFLLFAICLAWGLWHVFNAALRARQKAIGPALAAALCLLPVFSLWRHYAENNHRHYLVARDYGLNVLENLQPGALLLTMDWQLYSPLLYLQKVEGHRKDVIAVDVNLLRRSWYVAYLQREYPALMREAADEAEIYLRQLDLFEHDRPFNPNAIQQAFVNLINRLVDVALARHSAVYATVDLSEEPDAASAYFRVPVGPVFQLMRSQPSEPAPAGRFRIASFTDGRLMLDPVMLRVRKNYALMFVNRGLYLTLYGRQSEADEWLRKGISLDPGVEAMIPSGRR